MTPNPATPFILELNGTLSLRLDLCLPRTETTVHELLPAIFDVADAINDQSVNKLSSTGKAIGCGPGCGACCNQLVPISEYEAAHLAGVVRTMPVQQRSRVVSRFTTAIATLDASGMMTPLTDIFAHEAHDWRKMNALKARYWDLKIPCPFLEENSCSIHPHRPLICRQYLVTSPASHCAHLESADQAPEVVQHPADVGGALASFSGEGLQHSRVLPLIFSLLAERSIRSRPMSILPAPQMMDRFLNTLTTCFSRAQ